MRIKTGEFYHVVPVLLKGMEYKERQYFDKDDIDNFNYDAPYAKDARQLSIKITNVAIDDEAPTNRDEKRKTILAKYKNEPEKANKAWARYL